LEQPYVVKAIPRIASKNKFIKKWQDEALVNTY
jgi:hypothetical protein